MSAELSVRSHHQKRLPFIDILRVLAIFGVICIHTQPFRSIEGFEMFFFLIDHACRFAVPFFFIVSGYFIGKKIKKGIPVSLLWRSYIVRLLIIFVVWTCIYRILPQWTDLVESIIKYGYREGTFIVFKQLFINNLNDMRGHPMYFSLTGYLHLWFLPSLAIALSLLLFLIKIRKQSYILPLAIILYFFGLWGRGGSYSALANVLGWKFIPLHFTARNGPFFSTLFVALGWFWSQRKRPPLLSLSIILISLGYLTEVSEALFLQNLSGSAHFLFYDYSIGTVFFGFGVFLLGLARPNFGGTTILPKLGRLLMGVYLAHLLILHNILILEKYFNPIFWQILFPVLVYFFSVIFVSLLLKSKVTRTLVVIKE